MADEHICEDGSTDLRTATLVGAKSPSYELPASESVERIYRQ
jgi:hypothetical protein